jgi:hypothetical protein
MIQTRRVKYIIANFTWLKWDLRGIQLQNIFRGGMALGCPYERSPDHIPHSKIFGLISNPG